MLKAYKVLDAALDCKARLEEDCEIVCACVELVARDLRDLFLLYEDKLRWVVTEEEVGDLFEGWDEAEVRAVLSHFRNYYNDRCVFNSI